MPTRVDGLEGGDADHRVYVGDGRVRIFRAEGRGGVLVYESAVTSCAFAARGSWRITTGDGTELQVTRRPARPGEGCSCRSPLAKINRKTLRGQA